MLLKEVLYIYTGNGTGPFAVSCFETLNNVCPFYVHSGKSEGTRPIGVIWSGEPMIGQIQKQMPSYASTDSDKADHHHVLATRVLPVSMQNTWKIAWLSHDVCSSSTAAFVERY